ncbi:MAG: hypothetical protein ACLT98_04115 [Eggerthellaceae bacterium]
MKSYDTVNAIQVDAFFGRLQPQAISDGFLIVTADTAFIKTRWKEDSSPPYSRLLKTCSA